MVDIGQSIGSIGSGLGGVFSGASVILPYILLAAAVFFISFVYGKILRYNKTILVWRLSNGVKRLIIAKAMSFKDDNRVEYWRIKKGKLINVLTNVPPDKVISTDTKGKDVAQCYLTSYGEVIWIQDTFDLDKLVELEKIAKTKKEKGEQLDMSEVESMQVLQSFKPVTTSQRISFAYQQEKNKKYLKTQLLTMLPLIASGLFIVVILIIIVMFFGKIVEPMNAAAATVNAGKQIDLEILEELRLIKQNVQSVSGTTTQSDVDPGGT